MARTFKTIIEDEQGNGLEAMFSISSALSLEEPVSAIKEKSTEEAFAIFICVQTICGWQADGWAFGPFGNWPQMIPYTASAMRKVGLEEVAIAVEDVINTFPSFVNFGADQRFKTAHYVNVLNFIENQNRALDGVEETRLLEFSQEERERMCNAYKQAIAKAEAVSDKLLWYDNEKPFAPIIEYMQQNLHASLWKED